MPNFKHGQPSAGVYLRRLPYEQSYAASSAPSVRYANQDALISQTMNAETLNAARLRADASAESTVFSRYGLIYKQFMDLLTGFPE